jgi:hypothetical protein
MKTIMGLYVLLSVFHVFCTATQAIEKLNINLYEGTLNGRAFYTLTIKDIWTLLGKPSHQSRETSSGIITTDIAYQDLGFMARVTSDMNTCQLLLIDTTGKGLDEWATVLKVTNMKGKKYSGSIAPNIDGTWKLQSVVAQFKETKHEVNENDKSAAFQFKNHTIIFVFNKETELLEWISLIRNTPVKYKF